MSFEITIQVSVADAARIARAFNEGKLADAGVVGLRLTSPPPPPRRKPTKKARRS